MLFGIGFLGSCCSLFGQRLLAAFYAGGSIDSLSINVIILGLIFSVLVGFIVMIKVWNENHSPWEIFLMSLGIPAFLAGLFNSADGLRTGVDAQNKAKAVVENVRQAADVPIVNPASPGPAVPPAGPSSSLETSPRGFALAFDIAEERDYVVVGPYDTHAAAEAAGAAWGVTATTTQQGRFYVVLAGPLPYGDAIAEALRWRSRQTPVPAALLKAGADVAMIPIAKVHEMFPGATPGIIVADEGGGALFQEVTADVVTLASVTVTLGKMPQP